MTTHIYIYLSKDYPAGGYVVDYHGYEDYFLSLLKIMSERKIKKKNTRVTISSPIGGSEISTRIQGI